MLHRGEAITLGGDLRVAGVREQAPHRKPVADPMRPDVANHSGKRFGVDIDALSGCFQYDNPIEPKTFENWRLSD